MAYAAKVYKKYTLFSQALLNRTQVYNDNLQHVNELEKQGLVFVIAPDSIGGIKRTESDPVVIEALYQQGLDHFKAILPDLRSYLDS